MLADIASHFGGTPFDARYREMPPQQLMILRAEALRARKQARDSDFESKKAIVAVSEQLVDYLSFFVNPELFKKVQEAKELKKHEGDMPAENFEQEFARIEGMGLKKLYVPDLEEEEDPEPPPLPAEIEQAFEGGGLESFRRLSSAFAEAMDHTPTEVAFDELDLPE